ncbi:MAG TPA: hypothetical protein PLE97_02295, partial [Tenuifilaceae bacterium]|nr:hypothetical protein [Tenuifilaceae bacterium]
ALIFFGSFLYQDKKERLAGFSPKFCSRLIVSKLFRPFRACKIIRSIQGAAPLATYFAPLGLKPPDRFWNPPAGGQVLES